MLKSKKYFYDGDVIWDSDESVDASTLAELIVNDEELAELEEVVVGCWGESYDNSVQPILDKIVEYKDRFKNVKSFFIGDMGFEECEVSWIEQGDYAALLSAFPELKKLTVKGSNGLSLGDINHANLEELEIICGGLPLNVLNQIIDAKLPSLKKLNLYIGVEDYGFDGSLEDIKRLLNADFIKQLDYLGICDSELQDSICEELLKLDSLYDIKTLDLSKGTLTDVSGELIIKHIDKLRNLDCLDLTYHYLSDDMMARLKKLDIKILLDDPQEVYTSHGEDYYWPMLTE